MATISGIVIGLVFGQTHLGALHLVGAAKCSKFSIIPDWPILGQGCRQGRNAAITTYTVRPVSTLVLASNTLPTIENSLQPRSQCSQGSCEYFQRCKARKSTPNHFCMLDNGFTGICCDQKQELPQREPNSSECPVHGNGDIIPIILPSLNSKAHQSAKSATGNSRWGERGEANHQQSEFARRWTFSQSYHASTKHQGIFASKLFRWKWGNPERNAKCLPGASGIHQLFEKVRSTGKPHQGSGWMMMIINSASLHTLSPGKDSPRRILPTATLICAILASPAPADQPLPVPVQLIGCQMELATI